jgi:hypothetical protein
MTPRSLRRLLTTTAIATAALGAGATAADAATFSMSGGGPVPESGGIATFVVKFERPCADPDPLWSFTLRSGSAVIATDFDGVPTDGGGSTTSGGAPCVTTKSFEKKVAVLPDLLDEDDETFTVTVESGGGQVASGSATIVDDDATPTLEVDGGTLLEGDTGTRYIEGDVELSAPSGRNVTVGYTTLSGSASGSSDFGHRSGTLTIPAGETEADFDVPVFGDTEHEADEDFRISLSGATNAVIAEGDASVTIRNDDAVPPPPPLPTDLIVRTDPLPQTPNNVFINQPSVGGQPAAPAQQQQGQQPPAQNAGAKQRVPGEADELAWPVALSFKGMTTGPRVRVRCDAREELCKGRILVGLGGGPTLKTQRFTLDGGEARTITIRMSRKLRRKLRRAGQVYFKVVSTDAAGNRAQSTRGFEL